jgi:hypothetical protein
MSSGVAEADNATGAARHVSASLLRTTLLEHAPFGIVVLVYGAIGLPILGSLNRHIVLPLAQTYRIPVLVTVVYLLASLLGFILWLVFVRGCPPLSARLWRELKERWLPPERLVGTLLVLVLLPAFLALMLGFRTAITSFQPFGWDVAFMELDRWIHGGRHPWELLQPLLGQPGITRFIDGFYVYGWFLMLWVGVAWQTVHGKEAVRSQFLLTFLLMWVALGTVGAIAFSSAGPVYFSRVTGLTDPYGPLMAHLAEIDAQSPLRALAIQERLWSRYTEWGGITAMPSMHVGQTTVVFLAAARTYRWLGWLLAPALLLILVGSVHLGWHYAVDSYGGVLGAVAIWWLSGRVVRWWRDTMNLGGEAGTR